MMGIIRVYRKRDFARCLGVVEMAETERWKAATADKNGWLSLLSRLSSSSSSFSSSSSNVVVIILQVADYTIWTIQSQYYPSPHFFSCPCLFLQCFLFLYFFLSANKKLFYYFKKKQLIQLFTYIIINNYTHN